MADMNIGPIQRQVVRNEISDVHRGDIAQGHVPDVAAEPLNDTGVSALRALSVLLGIQPLAKP